MRHLLFTLVLAVLGRFFIWKDRRVGLPMPPTPEQAGGTVASRHRLKSGGNVLDACFVKPADCAPQAALLLCHGIGETVEHWHTAQCLLARHGVVSLVFNYSGYGRSSGWPSIKQCELDARRAYGLLAELAPGLPLSILGFSLGSGVATAIASSLQAHRLVLCAAFTSLASAGRSFGVPSPLLSLMPPAWKNELTLRSCTAPVLIVHGLEDRLFSSRMAEQLAAAGSPPHELLLVPGLSHDDPIYHPSTDYWLPIVARLSSAPPPPRGPGVPRASHAALVPQRDQTGASPASP